MSSPTEAQLAFLRKEVGDLDRIYEADKRGDSFRLFLTGDTGSGKTFTARSAPKYVHIDSFDPGGTQTLDDLIAKGLIFADTRFEVDDEMNPNAFTTWEKSFNRRLASGYFNTISTYYLDSLTTMGTTALNQVQKEKNRPGTTPQQDDWLPQMTKMEKMLRKVASLPCNVVVIGHLDLKEDKITGQLIYRSYITGKLAQRIPLLFSEVYVMQMAETPKGIRYAFLTQSTGRYVARTRLGKEGLFEKFEEPNIAGLLKKAGKPYEDRLYLQAKKEENQNG